MADAGAIKAGEAYVDISTRIGSAFKAGLARAQQGLQTWGQRMQRTGLAILGGLGVAAKFAADQELADKRLASALQSVGAGGKEAVAGLKAFASGIQEVTIFGDELVQDTMTSIINIAGLSGKALEDATTAAIGLAAAYDMDLKTAAMLVARAAKGQTQTLTRYGIVVDTTKDKAGQFADVLALGAAKFQLAKDAADTASGRFIQAKNALGDTAEEIGFALLPALTDLFRGLTDALKPIQDWIRANPQVIRGIAKVALGLTAAGTAALAASIAIKGFGAALAASMGGVVIAGLVVVAEKIGLIDLGFSKWVENVRIGSFKMSTWLAAVAIGFEIAWLKAITAIQKGWNTFKTNVLDWLPRKLFGLFGGQDLGPFRPGGAVAEATGGGMGALAEADLAKRNAALERSLAERLRALAAEREALFAADAASLEKAAKVVEKIKDVSGGLGGAGKSLASAGKTISTFSGRAAPLKVGSGGGRVIKLNEQQLKVQQDVAKSAIEIAASLGDLLGVVKAGLPPVARLGA